MKNLGDVTTSVYNSYDVYRFTACSLNAISFRDRAHEFSDNTLPKLFALEIEEWRLRDHPNEQMTAELMEDEKLLDFLVTPDHNPTQDYFLALSVGDWETLLIEYVTDHTDEILKVYHALFDE